MPPPSVTLETILATTRRLPYSENELNGALLFIKKELKNGLDVNFHPIMVGENFGESVRKWMNGGMLILACPQIESDIIFAKCNNGRGLLGGQKHLFSNYLGSVVEDSFEIGSSFKMLTMGLTGINNIFRSEGLLKGGAF